METQLEGARNLCFMHYSYVVITLAEEEKPAKNDDFFARDDFFCRLFFYRRLFLPMIILTDKVSFLKNENI